MKYAPSIAFEEMSGSAKGVTAAKAKGRKYHTHRDNPLQKCFCGGFIFELY